MALWLGAYPFVCAAWMAPRGAIGFCCTGWIDVVLLVAVGHILRTSSVWSPMALLALAINITVYGALLGNGTPVTWGLFIGTVVIFVTLAIHTFHPIVLWRICRIPTEQLCHAVGERRMERILRSME